MGQVSREFDLNPPNVRFRYIFASIYKAREHLDQGKKKKQERERERETIQLYLHPWTEPEDKHLAFFLYKF